MSESDVRALKRMLDESGSGEVCGTLARCMRDFADPQTPEDETDGERGHWREDAETLETLADKLIL